MNVSAEKPHSVKPKQKGCETAVRKRPPLKLSFDYMDTPERRVLSLEPDGISCLPVIGFDNYRKKWEEAPLHVHEECLEISLCLRGDLEIETTEKTYPFKPGHLFVSSPNELHRLKTYPKGMCKYWLLFRIPKNGFPLLGLPQSEADILLQHLIHLPRRLFHETDDIRKLFKKLFYQYDTLPRNEENGIRSLRLRVTALSLLLAIIDAANLPAREEKEVQLEQLIEKMRTNPGNQYPLEELAYHAALSANTLRCHFKKMTGLPPHAFLLEQRIIRAKEMLAQGNSIAFIADKLGFSSSQHFCNQFKTATGCVPSKWNKRMQR